MEIAVDAKDFYPGTRILVFDALSFENDIDTPLSVTMKPATVVKWYGYKHPERGIYRNLVDVRFDHRPDRISHEHFVDLGGVPCIEKMEEEAKCHQIEMRLERQR